MTAMDMAKYVLAKCTKDGTPINGGQLQKALYLLQCEFLGKQGRELFSDDFEAWDAGPVVPAVYHALSAHGDKKVGYNGDVPDIAERERKTIDRIIGDFVAKESANPYQVQIEINKPGRAWDKAYLEGENSVITKEAIGRFGLN